MPEAERVGFSFGFVGQVAVIYYLATVLRAAAHLLFLGHVPTGFCLVIAARFYQSSCLRTLQNSPNCASMYPGGGPPVE